MNHLTKVLIEDLLGDGKKKITAIYGGGFKPPTKGHFDVVAKAAEQNPEIDDFIIYVGGGERNGLTQGESIQIWELYKKYLPMKVRIEPVKSPIGDILRYAKDHPEEEVLWIIGARENNPEDFADISSRTRTLDKYPNLELRVIQTSGGVSGTAARNAVKSNDKEQFFNMIPDIAEKQQVWDIVSPIVKEGRKKKSDPKKGTGKKPEGSARRLYTDENPKDTVRIKFKTKEDIVDTLNKTSFKAKPHVRQSQVINLIHQRVRAAYSKAKDPDVKSRLKRALDYIEKRKEMSKKKTERLRKLKEIVTSTEIICDNCGWEWKIVDGGDDLYICHKCGHDNTPTTISDFDLSEGDTYEKMAAKGKKSGNLKQGTVRDRLNIPKDEKVPMGKINKELSRLKKMDQDEDKKGVQLGDKNQKYYKALQLSKTLKSTTNINENDPFSLNELARQFVKETLKETWKPEESFVSLSKYMIDNGMNIKPLPKIKVISDDKDNASNLLGKTAYYNPAEKSITLYTMDRHPKDILRSFSHEMVHHEQNLNGRLNNIKTTNTNEDGVLPEIEREAYEKGNMMLRNWEDSLKNV